MSKLLFSFWIDMHFGKVLKYCDLQHFLWEKDSFKFDWGGSETFCVRVGVARGWPNFAARPVLCGVGKVDHIRHPGADMWMYLSTDVYHIRRCPLLRNTTHVHRVVSLVPSENLILWRFSDKNVTTLYMRGDVGYVTDKPGFGNSLGQVPLVALLPLANTTLITYTIF